MAIDYVQMTLIFRELYHQDLLDTTYYAHNSFLTSKREVEVPKATRGSHRVSHQRGHRALQPAD